MKGILTGDIHEKKRRNYKLYAISKKEYILVQFHINLDWNRIALRLLRELDTNKHKLTKSDIEPKNGGKTRSQKLL